MPTMNASISEKCTRVMNAVAAGTTDQNSSSVDMVGFNGVKFYTSFGTITASAVTSVKIQTSSDDSSWNDLENSSITVADDDDNQITVHDINRPLERYLRVVVDRGTQNAVIDGVIACQYGAIVCPTTDDSSTVVAREIHATPAEGTA